jgi:HSP20 family protein
MFRNHQSAGPDHQFQQHAGAGFCGQGKHRFGRRFGGGQAPWMKYFGDMFNNRVPVNIEEDEQAFHLHLYAPGISKDAVKISVKDDVLSIAYQAPEKEEQPNKFAHREYGTASFERLFQLNDKVLTDQISAAYNDGILKVSLPRNPETNKPAQHIKVS